MTYKPIDVLVDISTREQIVLEIKDKAGIDIDANMPQLIYAQSVVVKASYLLFPTQGKDGVLYVDKSDKQIYVYDIDSGSYEEILYKLVPMTDDEVTEMVERIKGDG